MKIKVNHEEVEKVTMELYDMGFMFTEIIDNAFIEEIIEKKHIYHWDFIDESLMELDRKESPIIKVYIEIDGNEKKSVKKIKDQLYKYEIEENILDDSEWKDNYKKHFKTMKLTETLVVKPSWEDYNPKKDEKIIELDPGQAFGTGDHETTSMCAILLEKNSCEGKTILDVGTGSGILAIGAGFLGAEEVLGIDIDNDAVEVAKYNVKKNNCIDVVKIQNGDLLKGIDYKADIIVANLVAELIILFIKDIKKHLNKNGIFISSGILKEKENLVVDAMENEGMIVKTVLCEGDWIAIEARYE